jgi:hypothetical protein
VSPATRRAEARRRSGPFFGLPKNSMTWSTTSFGLMHQLLKRPMFRRRETAPFLQTGASSCVTSPLVADRAITVWHCVEDGGNIVTKVEAKQLRSQPARHQRALANAAIFAEARHLRGTGVQGSSELIFRTQASSALRPHLHVHRAVRTQSDTPVSARDTRPTLRSGVLNFGL